MCTRSGGDEGVATRTLASFDRWKMSLLCARSLPRRSAFANSAGVPRHARLCQRAFCTAQKRPRSTLKAPLRPSVPARGRGAPSNNLSTIPASRKLRRIPQRTPRSFLAALKRWLAERSVVCTHARTTERNACTAVVERRSSLECQRARAEANPSAPITRPLQLLRRGRPTCAMASSRLVL